MSLWEKTPRRFEAGKGKVGKKGVVRDSKVHVEVVKDIYDFCLNNGFDVLHTDFSPIKGPQGNIEYLIHIRKSEDPQDFAKTNAEELVEISHKSLD